MVHNSSRGGEGIYQPQTPNTSPSSTWSTIQDQTTRKDKLIKTITQKICSSRSVPASNERLVFNEVKRYMHTRDNIT